MASARGRSKDSGVTEEELRALECELRRTREIEENQKRFAVVRQKRDALQEEIEASRPPKKKAKAPSIAPESRNEGRVLRSSGRKDHDHVDPAHQPSKEITNVPVDDDDVEDKGGRKITKNLNIYARQNKSKIKIPLNEHGQPVGPDATEFANFIGTLLRKHIPPVELDWRDVDEAKKLVVWENLRAYYELDSTALRYVYNTSHTKWKEWKAYLRRTRFDPALSDEELMKRCDKRISDTDWETLISYWRSPEFEARSARAKENRAKLTVSHTTGSKSYARVSQEMAEELGYAPRRDEVYIKTHTRKSGDHLPQAAPIIKQLTEAAVNHPEWKEKSIKDGDLYAKVCGMKEPRGRVRLLGQGPTPQDVGTPGTRGKMTTRVLVEMEARRQAEQRMDAMQQQMQQMQQQLNHLMLVQGGHNVDTPISQHGSNSRQNSRVDREEDNDNAGGVEEDDDEETFVHRRVITRPPPPPKSFSTQDESLIGMDVLLYAWIGPETPVAKATILSIDQDTIVGGDPLGTECYEIIVNVSIRRDATLPCQYDGLRYVSDAVTRSIAWPSSKIKPYKPGASSSSRS